MADPREGYVVRRFRTPERGGSDYGQAADWIRAVGLGFHEKGRSDEYIDKVLAMHRVDGRELTGVYLDGRVPEQALPATFPVATFGTMRKSLNVGYGRQVEAHLVTEVTVRGTHRRQGLLRQLMTEDLSAAREDGASIAALTASEGSIYRRFGYGVATFERSMTVDTGPRFRLDRPTGGIERPRTVELADRRVLLELGPAVFERVQGQTPGSVGRQESYRQQYSGQFGRDGREDDAVKCALHFDAHGHVDGYVSYKFAGWDKKPYTMDILDLVAATDSAYLDLWQFLGSIDLVDRISWRDAPVDDPLQWALADPRCLESANERDMLWLRVLDAPAALSARQYSADGRLILEVDDALGLTGGTWVLESNGAGATAKAAATGTTPDLSLDVADLGSIYLGGVSPVTLAAAGRVREHRKGAALKARQMFAVERSPHCLTHF